MNVTSDAPQPFGRPSSITIEPSRSGPDRNKVLQWRVDTRTRTAKCRLCGHFVKSSSNVCRGCNQRICSDCVQGVYDDQDLYYQEAAHDMLEEGCWCGHLNGFNPAFCNRKPCSLPEQPPRAKRKRDCGTAYLDESGHAVGAGAESARLPLQPLKLRPSSMRIVVIGAGVIGLFIALELAKQAQHSEKEVDICVIDIEDRPCKLASGCGTGILDTACDCEQLRGLMTLSKSLWEGLAESSEFREAVHYRNSTLILEHGKKETKRHGSRWFHCEEGEYLRLAKTALGRVAPLKLARWLETQCRHYDVQIRYATRANKILVNSAGSIRGLEVEHISERTTQVVYRSWVRHPKHMFIPCSNVVVAAGAFTANLAKSLLSSRSVQLHDEIYEVPWLELKVEISKRQDVGILLPVIGAEFTGVAKLTASHQENLVAVCGPMQKPQFDSEALRRTADHDSTAQLQELVAARLTVEGKSLRRREAYSKRGVSFIGTGHAGLPIIGRLHGSTPHLTCSRNSSVTQDGVWLCYGFGEHGVTLAPGAARLLGEMIYGKDVEVDCSAFAVAELERTAH